MEVPPSAARMPRPRRRLPLLLSLSGAVLLFWALAAVGLGAPVDSPSTKGLDASTWAVLALPLVLAGFWSLALLLVAARWPSWNLPHGGQWIVLAGLAVAAWALGTGDQGTAKLAALLAGLAIVGTGLAVQSWLMAAAYQRARADVELR